MPSVSSLKDRARKEEKRGNWPRAVELYRQALERAERNGDLMRELGIYNRIGDLELRMKQPADAIASFLEAVERYSEEGLPAPAVALCNKILRAAPDRDDVRMRIVRLHLEAGLVADARQALLDVVRRADASGHARGALEAILGYLELSEDEPLRLEAAERLYEASRPHEAIEQVEKVREARAARGEDVSVLDERIRAMTPPVTSQPPPTAEKGDEAAAEKAAAEKAAAEKAAAEKAAAEKAAAKKAAAERAAAKKAAAEKAAAEKAAAEKAAAEKAAAEKAAAEKAAAERAAAEKAAAERAAAKKAAAEKAAAEKAAAKKAAAEKAAAKKAAAEQAAAEKAAAVPRYRRDIPSSVPSLAPAALAALAPVPLHPDAAKASPEETAPVGDRPAWHHSVVAGLEARALATPASMEPVRSGAATTLARPESAVPTGAHFASGLVASSFTLVAAATARIGDSSPARAQPDGMGVHGVRPVAALPEFPVVAGERAVPGPPFPAASGNFISLPRPDFQPVPYDIPGRFDLPARGPNGFDLTEGRALGAAEAVAALPIEFLRLGHAKRQAARQKPSSERDEEGAGGGVFASLKRLGRKGHAAPSPGAGEAPPLTPEVSSRGVVPGLADVVPDRLAGRRAAMPTAVRVVADYGALAPASVGFAVAAPPQLASDEDLAPDRAPWENGSAPSDSEPTAREKGARARAEEPDAKAERSEAAEAAGEPELRAVAAQEAEAEEVEESKIEPTGDEPAAEAAEEPEPPHEASPEEPGPASDQQRPSLTDILRRRWTEMVPGKEEPQAPESAGDEPQRPAAEAGTGAESDDQAAALDALMAPDAERDEDFPNLTGMLERMGWLGGSDAEPVPEDEAVREDVTNPAPWKQGKRPAVPTGSPEGSPGEDGPVVDEEMPNLTSMLKSLGWLSGGEEESDESDDVAEDGDEGGEEQRD